MNFLKTVAAVIVAQILIVFVLFLVVGGIGIVSTATKKPEVESHSWLALDVYGEIPEYAPPDAAIAEIFGEDTETLTRLLDNLEKAAVDDRIDGVIVRISASNTLGRAGVEEVRRAIARVREAGKPVYAFSDGLDRSSLYLATACDTIIMPPPAEVVLLGMGVVREHYRGLLDKLGIRPNIHRIREYKSAAEPFLRKKMSKETREMIGWMLDEYWDMEVRGIARARGLSEDDLVHDMEHAMFTAEEAREAGLIDQVAWWTDLARRLEGKRKKLRIVSSKDYGKVARASLGLSGDKRVAVIHLQGMIGGRKSRTNPTFGMMIGHETAARQIRRAAGNDKIAAIVLRVNSPGGESLASQAIAAAVAEARRKKPVIVSMVNVAASGGYAISYKATKIVADSATVTGSIGSISGKFNTAGMYGKIGLTFDWVTRGPNALFFSPVTDFTPEQRKRFEEAHWKGFNQWFDDIARERHIPPDSLRELAMGRVWTGRQALANGLVDALGGLNRALEIAREEAGIDAKEKLTLVHYPKERGLFEMLFGDDDENGWTGALWWMVRRSVRSQVLEFQRMAATGRLMLWTGEEVR